MSLIKCTECGKEFSDKAECCPNCGCPVAKMNSLDDETDKAIQNNEDMGSETGTNESVPNEDRKGKSKRYIQIGAIATAVIAIAGTVGYFATANIRAYGKAQDEFEASQYTEALATYEKLGDYKDSADLARECEYQIAEGAFSEESYQDALVLYQKLKDYKESAQRIKECEYQLSVDGQFMKAMSTGLQKRWDQYNSDANNGIGESAITLANYCQIELDAIGKFKDQEFNDPNLKTDMLSYIDLLSQAKEAAAFYTIDYSKYSTEWGEIYNKRAILLQKFTTDYGLNVDSKYQDTMAGLLNDATAAEKIQKMKSDIKEMTNSFTLTSIADEWGSFSYKLDMTNSTSYTFNYFYVDVSVVDSDGKIIQTGTSSQLASWTPGTAAEVDIYLDANQDATQYKIEYTPHYQSGSFYE